jgi:rare lipoprotein A (peptidoglycan hydrolase)
MNRKRDDVPAVNPWGMRLRSGGPRLALAFALLLVLPLAFGAADQVWEGNAGVVRKGEFGTPGFFAASDSFPKSTLLQVENPQNGKTVQVTVVERINGRGNMFLLLSEQAAAALDFSASDVIRVKTRVLVSAGTTRGGAGLEDLASSPDPDVNPAAGLAEAQASAGKTPRETPVPPKESTRVTSAPLEESPREAPAAKPQEDQTAAAGSETMAEEAREAEPKPAVAEVLPAQPEPPAGEPRPAGPEPAIAEPEALSEAPASEAESSPAAEAASETPAPAEPRIAANPTEEPAAAAAPSAKDKRLEELAERVPQKQLFRPPQPAQPVAAAPPRETPAEAEVTPAGPPPPVEEAPAEQPTPEASLAQPETVPPEAAPMAEVQAEEEGPALSLGAPGPQTEEGQPGELPEPGAEAPEAGPAEIPPAVEEALPAAPEPEAPAPPPVAEAPAPAQVAVAPAALTAPEIQAGKLMRRSFYLQLGAYSTRSLAEKLAKELTANAHYTVEVLPISSGDRLLYKVVLGPLNRDESGTLLFQFRARGFKDAFVQYVE